MALALRSSPGQEAGTGHDMQRDSRSRLGRGCRRGVHGEKGLTTVGSSATPRVPPLF